MSFNPSFGSSTNAYNFSQALTGGQTMEQQANQEAGSIVHTLGGKVGGTVGGIASKVGQLYQIASKVQPPIRSGPVTQLRTASGQYHTVQGFSMENGGVVPGSDRASLGPRYYRK
jgi:hypothetical protein